MDEAILITDGSADNKRGTGGWCAIIRVDSSLTEITGWEESTTSNRMELTAAIEGLRALKQPTKVTLISDSTYMLKTLRNKWYVKWFEEGQTHRPNLDLWHMLVGLVQYHDVTLIKVKGHSGDYWNDRADHLAKRARSGHERLNQFAENFDPTRRCEILLREIKQCQLFAGHLGDCYFSARKYKLWDNNIGDLS